MSAPTAVLLAGRRVVHLAPFFVTRGYEVYAHKKAERALKRLRRDEVALIVFELAISEDQGAEDFVLEARATVGDAAFLLLDNPSRANQIVQLMKLGLEGFVPAPPNEDELFFAVERLLGSRQNGESSEGQNGVDVDAMNAALEEAQREVSALRAELEAQKLATLDANDSVEIPIEMADEERIQLEAELESLRVEHDETREALERAESAAAEATRELAELRVRTAALEATLEDHDPEADEKIASLEQSLEEERGTQEEVNAALKIHQQRASDLNEEKQSLVTELAAAREDLESARSQLEHARGEQTRADTELETVREDLANAQGHGESLQQKLDEAEAQLEGKVGDLRAQLEEQRQARRMVEDELETSRGELDDEKKAHEATRASLEDVSGKVQGALDDREVYEDKALEAELAVDGLKARIQALEDEVAAKIEEMNEQEAHFKKEKLRLIEEREDAASGSHEAYGKMEGMVVELRNLEAQHRAVFEETQRLHMVREELEGKLKRAEQQIESLTSKVSS